MKPNSAKILVDEDFPYSVLIWLRNLGYDVVRSSEINLRGASDREIIRAAIKENRIIFSLDIDFAPLYYQLKASFGVVIMHVHPSTPEKVKKFLDKLLTKVRLEKHIRSLILVSEKRIEVIQEQKS
ncbi:MAG: DUF5615 family PIN-like protein [Euryarchaeota archaeon]|nr:DUF5615 family PIN-like protein [Euryarchaeota archaeon]